MKEIMHIIFVKLKDVERLELQFATLTESGWVIPEWLVYLRSVAK